MERPDLEKSDGEAVGGVGGCERVVVAEVGR